ncbi:MAG: Tectiviridae, minor capsid [Rhodobacteraceae bacterium HLUCCA08]|nr:MAG: Tectiviridae, minor capsid [Rhodobacteraceae bacterium HLUCCA08]
MNLAEVDIAARAARLAILGGFHPGPGEGLGGTLLLLGPGPDFWHHFVQSPEYRDGAPDPLDRWSVRVLGRIAEVSDARALFPFGGPPHHPFQAWAERSGRAWRSPVGLLVHADQGLWVSYRGALVVDATLDLPETTETPCDICADRPCLTACPVGALTGQAYDVPGCKAFLTGGGACMETGCAVRAACPVSRDFPRNPRQSAFHMRAFL